jgi:hypothetical protein
LTIPTKQNERRLSPSHYRLLLATHIVVSGAWLGVVVTKLVLGLTAVTAADPDRAATLAVATAVVNPAFPPLAIGTIVTGVLLSLGTKWGLLQHYWVAVKLGLTVGVIATAVQLGDRYLRQAIATLSGSAVESGTMGMEWGSGAAHLALRRPRAHARHRNGHLGVQTLGQDLAWPAAGGSADGGSATSARGLRRGAGRVRPCRQPGRVRGAVGGPPPAPARLTG